MGAHLAARLLEARQGFARMHLRVRQRGAHQRVQHVPRDLGLRLVAALHDLAVAVEEDAVARRPAQRAGMAQAREVEGVQHVGLQHDAAAPAVQGVPRTLEYVHPPADGAQGERGEQAAEGAADDEGARCGGVGYGGSGWSR